MRHVGIQVMGNIHVSARMDIQERIVKLAYRTVHYSHVQMEPLVLYVMFLFLEIRV